MSDRKILSEAALNETLSALVDNEAGKTDVLELRRLVRAMENDPGLAERYQRFSVGSAVMRGEAITVPTDFLSRVQKGIDAGSGGTQTDNDVNKTERRPWLKVAGQFAVAASVAIVAIGYVQTNRLPGTSAVTETAVLTETKKLGDNMDNRLLNPRVLTVGAGNGFTRAYPSSDRSVNPAADCVVIEQELPANSGLHQLQLPEGYVLCRMDESRQRCHAVSSALACASR